MELSVKESYDQIAEYFSITRIFTWKWTDDFINKLNNNSLVLDIGSGNGRNTKYNNCIIFGIDISFKQLQMNSCKNKYDVQANMINIPYRDNFFDAIISIASFHHLSTVEEREMSLKEMKRILIPNGKILLSVWSITQPKKIKLIFNNYGDTIINWTTKDRKFVIPRYYYIFKIDEIKNLLTKYFTINNYKWDCGNEIFELINNKI